MSGRQLVAAGLLVLTAGCSGAPQGQQQTPSSDASPPDERAAPRSSVESSAEASPEASDGARDPLAAALGGTPAAPGSAREAADQIEAADRVVREREPDSERLAAAGHTQQLAYRAVADRPGWDRRVDRLLPPVLRRETRANVAARRAFRSMHPRRSSDLASELPAWRIVEPRPAGELLRHYREAERRYGVDWEYLAAINLVETGFGRIDGTSVAGAQGPMQFIPTTWDIYGRGDVRDPRDAILAAGRLLRANDFRRDPTGSLYNYNNSTAYVRGVSLYARVMRQRPETFRAYHQWPVYYLTRAGSVWLPTGYDERRPVPVRRWLEREGRRALS